jgi:hypothetical protein
MREWVDQTTELERGIDAVEMVLGEGVESGQRTTALSSLVTSAKGAEGLDFDASAFPKHVMSRLKAKTFGELLKARDPLCGWHRAEEGPTRTTTRNTRN